MIKIEVSSEHSSEIQSFVIDGNKAIIGRKHSCEVALESDYVSREHLEITLDEDVIYIQDISGENWVSYNDEKLEKNKKIQYFNFSSLSLPGGFKLKIEIGRNFEPELEKTSKNTERKISVKKNINKKIKLEKRKSELKTGRRPKNVKSKKLGFDRRELLLLLFSLVFFIGAFLFYLFGE
jgi:predicted component of type VI protein secretion system